MTRCFEVSTKRSIITEVDSMSIYSRDPDLTFPCRDEELFESISIGDFVLINDKDVIYGVVTKERYLLGTFKNQGELTTISR